MTSTVDWALKANYLYIMMTSLECIARCMVPMMVTSLNLGARFGDITEQLVPVLVTSSNFVILTSLEFGVRYGNVTEVCLLLDHHGNVS